MVARGRGAAVSGRRRRERAFAPAVPAPLERWRAMSRFGRLRGRAVTLGFVAIGPIVEADTPEQLADAVAAAMAAETGRRWPS